MNEVETQEIIGEMEPGACWGTWIVSDKACSNCALAKRCEEHTKTKNSKTTEEIQDVADESSEDGMQEVSPVEFLIGTLAGKYEKVSKESDIAKSDYFRKDGKLVVGIIVSKKSGKIKIESLKGVKTIGPLKTIEDAQGLLKELSL